MIISDSSNSNRWGSGQSGLLLIHVFFIWITTMPYMCWFCFIFVPPLNRFCCSSTMPWTVALALSTYNTCVQMKIILKINILKGCSFCFSWYVCMHVCVCVCEYACVGLRMCMHVCVCECVCMCVSVCMNTYVCIHVSRFVWAHVCSLKYTDQKKKERKKREREREKNMLRNTSEKEQSEMDRFTRWNVPSYNCLPTIQASGLWYQWSASASIQQMRYSSKAAEIIWT